ncbi:hypothetical protein NIIDNTM18_45520 [Mycolicibacterium litorale]|uniref:Uncharacterized protein n=1 Tax=Mycolicibacterium litorale TaxID=758802 RepID=A0A6S6P9B6_9MYCO|nr:hypothetical protein NIIDNTM18_45520 [Mycolicibacterium litorale]
MRSAALTLAAPDADQRQQGEQCVVENDPFAKIRGVRGEREIVENRDVARRGDLGPFGGIRYGAVAGCREDGPGGVFRFVRRGHDSSVMRRYSAYSANHVITSVQTTSRIS